MANFNERIFKDGGKKPFRKNRKYLRRDKVKPFTGKIKEKSPELIERQKRFVKPKYFPLPTLVEKRPPKRPPKKGGGIAQRGLGRAFNKGGKV